MKSQLLMTCSSQNTGRAFISDTGAAAVLLHEQIEKTQAVSSLKNHIEKLGKSAPKNSDTSERRMNAATATISMLIAFR